MGDIWFAKLNAVLEDVKPQHTIIRHRQDRYLSDRTVPPLDSSSALINGRQICVHVTWVTSSTRNFFTSSRNLSNGCQIFRCFSKEIKYLSQSICVRRHVGQDNQHMLLELICIVLRCSKGKSRGNDTFNSWVVGQVQE